MPTFAITPANASVLLIDVQERFVPSIPGIAPDQPCGRACRVLLEGATLLGVPVTISEQYPKGLGATLPQVLAAAPSASRLEKSHFSCGDDPGLSLHLDRLGREAVIIAGIEAHVCVLATVADLRARGRTVIVAADAVASRR
ncbi:MAG: isochorismatase family protein, partial [Planctomycetes bacterium]|nr:isochorismatase family protein [Planctomycetota bacterium]